jgi:hypothetical protein
MTIPPFRFVRTAVNHYEGDLFPPEKGGLWAIETLVRSESTLSRPATRHAQLNSPER